jgi:hypothetical protein
MSEVLSIEENIIDDEISLKRKGYIKVLSSLKNKKT